ncbi:dephospho-CoA kinase [Wigglesworthia glossinidia endosymbiont of Glossina morsitans morsitans (Yale colony)]|uniref:Dephospho-CoA kinase n=1 Tax=Wigglesworthia glossinidia endosymbiont of Glossina morsitans morsitans (Yale colony) TaxID=1142511 RepID=H6Q5C1_WIGGL|nr:dephospho-CoA kinase [Wigglesworthia glossinidia]AFA41406.1 dephospho-CoA kinase [Wigglesworthia glossinidia endosymbiont of Glossina morsitans morsitans (Yale colony)]
MKYINNPYIVGLTGGIGSGKSTISKMFKKFNIPIIESDLVAKNIIFFKKDIYKKIKSKVGMNTKLKNKNFVLREYIFESSHNLLWINQLIHPIVIRKIKNIIKKYTKFPYIIWVSPLLIENNLQFFVDRVLLINVDPDLQLKRASLRDKLEKEKIFKIFNFQISQENRLQYAHDVINNYNLDTVKKKVFFYTNII